MSVPTIILIGFEKDIREQLKEVLSSVNVVDIPLGTKFVGEIDPALEPSAILTKTPMISDGFTIEELGQLIRLKFNEVPLFAYFKNKEGFKKELLENNGFNDIYLLPSDLAQMKSTLVEIITVSSLGEVQFYRPVRILDINAGDKLEFDTNVYLPVNRKYVKVTNAGESFSEEKIKKIKDHHFNTIHVVYDQLGLFYSYMAEKLRSIANSGFGVTEKRDRLSNAVRSILTDFFQDGITSFDSGQRILNDCAEIVKLFIKQGNNPDWYGRIEEVLGQNQDEYSHAGNVSTLAALFSIGTGIGKPEDLALAGLIHDVGTVELPYEIRAKRPEKMLMNEFEEYKKHPILSMNLIKSKKIVISDHVTKIIQQHHELYNGDGYPNGIFGDRILKESQILAIADHFDYLINTDDDNENRVTPRQAAEILKKEQGTNPLKFRYHPDVFEGIQKLFAPMSPLSE